MIQKFWHNNRGFLFAVAMILIGRSVLLDQYHVPSGSMIPNILIGDRLLVNKAAYQLRVPFSNIIIFKTGDPQRGEIVIFDHPRDEDRKVMVKRLIGIPGDSIRISPSEVFINDKLVETIRLDKPENLVNEYYTVTLDDRQFTIQRIPEAIRKDEFLTFKVPENEYFFMGDNRENSQDSRFWGFVPRELIKGKAMNVTFSLNGFAPRWSRFGHNLYKGPTEYTPTTLYDQ